MSIAAVSERYRNLPGIGRAALVAAALGLAWAVAAVVLPQGAPPGAVLTGAILGSATALAAMGLILIYRSDRVVNFAYGAMGAATGVAAIRLFLIWGWPYWSALLAGVASGVLLGALVEVVVIRRFEQASRLVLTVATIGLTQLLGGLELLLPGWLFGDDAAVTFGGFETPLSAHRFTVGVDVINGDHLLILAVVPVVVAALAWFLGRSRPGAAVRAAAENADRARLLGIPVRRVRLLVWAIAGGLATLTLMLKAPFAGTPPTVILGPAVLLPALTAAVIARMESLPVAVVAAMALGATDQVVRWNTSIPTSVDVVMLGVIVIALLLQRRGRSRAHDGDATWQDVAAARPMPSQISSLPEVRVARWGGLALLVTAAVVVPLWLRPSQLNTANLAVIWAIVAVSVVVLTGWCGQISLGQFAFVGCGAMVAGNLMHHWNVDYFLCLAAAAGGGALVALLLGVPALRIRGPFLAVVTLAFAAVLDGYVLNPNNFPDLVPQSLERPVLWERWPLQDERTFLYLALALLGLCLLWARGMRRSRSGRVILAGRDNPKATEAMAVSTRRMALSGFLFSGAIAGLAGGLHVALLNGVQVGSYPTVQSVEVFSMTTIGGLSSLGGGVVGTAGLRTLQDGDPGLRLVLMGLGVLVVLYVVPGGLAGVAQGVRDRLVRRLARRRGIEIAGLGPAALAAPESPALPSASSATTAQVAANGSGPNGHPPPVPALAARGIDVSYGQLQVLFGVDLEVAEGEVVALLGTNGAGKSTLLKALCGLVGARGSARLGGDEVLGRTPEQLVRDGVALMPGGRSIFPTLDVAEHLRLATWTFRRDHDRIEADTARVLELFPSLDARLHTLGGDLSGGEQQQLALAQTLLLRPRVLLIDELSLGLAPTIVGQLLEVVRALHASGTTIVVVEQSVNVALSVAQRAVFMEKGQVRFAGPTRELLDRPDVLRSVFLEGAVALDDHPEVRAEGAADDLPVVRVAELEELTAAGPTGTAKGGPVLECRGLHKRFGGITAVDQVDLVVQPGEIVGLVGQNGAGKTTILDCISGFHRLDGGRILFRDHDVTDWQPWERARGRMGRSFQEARLFPSLTVRETVAVACERHATSRAVVADVFRQPASYESELAIGRRVDALVELLGLGDHRDKLTAELSTGTRRIVELACLLAEDPVLLLLDEPSAGVAQKETEHLGPLLGRIRDVTGAGIVVIEHDMPLLSGLCDRMVALELGAVIAEGPPADVLADPVVVASYLGTDAAAIHRSGATVA